MGVQVSKWTEGLPHLGQNDALQRRRVCDGSGHGFSKLNQVNIFFLLKFFYFNSMTSVNNSLSCANRILQYLYDNTWFDVYTRAIFVEFTVYNANVNLFCIATLMLETTAIGMHILCTKKKSCKVRCIISILFDCQELSSSTVSFRACVFTSRLVASTSSLWPLKLSTFSLSSITCLFRWIALLLWKVHYKLALLNTWQTFPCVDRESLWGGKNGLISRVNGTWLSWWSYFSAGAHSLSSSKGLYWGTGTWIFIRITKTSKQ